MAIYRSTDGEVEDGYRIEAKEEEGAKPKEATDRGPSN
jgi:hypothetical protein